MVDPGSPSGTGDDRRRRWWRRPGPLLQCLLVLGLLVFLVVDGRLVIDPAPYLGAPLDLLLAAAALVMLNQVAVGLRFHLLARSVSAALGAMAALRVCAWGNLLGLVGLGGAGGDVARLVLLRREGLDVGHGSALIMVDRITAVVGLVAIASIGAVVVGDALATSRLGVVISAIHFTSAGSLAALAVVLGSRAPAWSWRRLAAGMVPPVIAIAGMLAFGSGLVDVLGCAAVIGGAAVGPSAAVVLERIAPLLSAAAPAGHGSASASWLARLAAAARTASRTIGAFRRRPLLLVGTTLLSIACQLPLVLAAALLARAFSASSDLWLEVQMVATAVAILTAGIPLPGGGLGVGEAAYDQIFRSATGSAIGMAGVFLALRVLLVLTPATLVLLLPLVTRLVETAGGGGRAADPDPQRRRHGRRPGETVGSSGDTSS